MNNLPLVSVIIPNFNNAHWLPKCIQSCLDQGELLKEIIVVDDHSTDNSMEMLSDFQNRYPDIIKVFTNPKKGANHARNYGFEQSAGAYIQWLDADDQIFEGKFQHQIEAMKRDNADIAYADFRIDYYKDRNLEESEVKMLGTSSDYLLELIKDFWNVTHSYLIRRPFAERLHDGVGWNPKTKVGQDREYFTMAGILGAKFLYVPGIFAVYNIWSNNTISRKYKFKEIIKQVDILLNRFRIEILQEKDITDTQKRKYQSFIDSQLLKGMFYDISIKPNKYFNVFKINYGVFHPKMKPIIPFLVLYKNLKFYFSDK